MIQGETLGFVERYQDPREECLVLLFEREGETVNDRSEYLEQFGNTIVTLGLVDELEKDIVDGSTDKGS